MIPPAARTKLVAIRLIFEDGHEETPELWGVAWTDRVEEGFDTFNNWSGQPKSNDEVAILGVAIEDLAERYAQEHTPLPPDQLS